MDKYERRMEIIKILMSRGKQTVGILACDLNVAARTIYTDLTWLESKYPIESKKGPDGGVFLRNYNIHQNILTREQLCVLEELALQVEQYHKRILLEIIAAYGPYKKDG